MEQWMKLRSEDVFHEVFDNVHLVASGDGDYPMLYDVATKEDEAFVYHMCEALAAGLNARHPEWRADA